MYISLEHFLFFVDLSFFQCDLVNNWVVKSIVVPLDTDEAIELFVTVQLYQHQGRYTEAMDALLAAQKAAISKVGFNVPSHYYHLLTDRDKMPPPPKYNICSPIEDCSEDIDTGDIMEVEMEVEELRSNNRLGADSLADSLAICQRWQRTLNDFFFGTPPEVSILNLSFIYYLFLHKCRLQKSNRPMMVVFPSFKKCDWYDLQHTSIPCGGNQLL
jgi:hypothetical protein